MHDCAKENLRGIRSFSRCRLVRTAVLCLKLAFVGLLPAAQAEHETWIPEKERPVVHFPVSSTQEAADGKYEIVEGNFVVHGNFTVSMFGDLAYVSRIMLSSICGGHEDLGGTLPILLQPRQDIKTLWSEKVGLNMSFQMLAPKDFAVHCVTTLRFVGYGPPEGPYDVVKGPKPPPIREFWKTALENYGRLPDFKLDEWSIAITNTFCITKLVSFPQDFSPEKLLERSTLDDDWKGREEPAYTCDGRIDPISMWSPDGDGGFQFDDMCALASTSCLCASVAGCGWTPHRSGGKRCYKGFINKLARTRVSCEDCPSQPDCPVACSESTNPCLCMHAPWGCMWLDNISACVDRTLGSIPDVPCGVCAWQEKCELVQLTSVEPLPWSYMGDEDFGWHINLTFDRPVMWGPIFEMTKRAIHLTCQSDDEVGAGKWVKFNLHGDTVDIDGDRLIIDVQKVPNSKLRFCELTILHNALSDFDFIPFAGTALLKPSKYMVGDAVPPRLLNFLPRNSATEIKLDVVVEFLFDEEISAAAHTFGNVSIVMIALGGQGWDGNPNDVIRNFTFLDPEVSIPDDSKSLFIDLAGLLRPDVFYSFELKADAVADLTGNLHEGLDFGLYAFRTVQRVDEMPAEGLALPVELLAGLISSVGVAGACSIGIWRFLIWCRQRRSSLEESSKVAPEADVEAVEETEDVRMQKVELQKRQQAQNELTTVLKEAYALHTASKEQVPEGMRGALDDMTYQVQFDEHYIATGAFEDLHHQTDEVKLRVHLDTNPLDTDPHLTIVMNPVASKRPTSGRRLGPSSRPGSAQSMRPISGRNLGSSSRPGSAQSMRPTSGNLASSSRPGSAQSMRSGGRLSRPGSAESRRSEDSRLRACKTRAALASAQGKRPISAQSTQAPSQGARPGSAGSMASHTTGRTGSKRSFEQVVEVYEYYILQAQQPAAPQVQAVPPQPPLEQPPSMASNSQPAQTLGDATLLPDGQEMQQRPRSAQHSTQRPRDRGPGQRPTSAGHVNRERIKSLHASYQTGKPALPPAKRPKSAPSLRVQHRMVDDYGAVVYKQTSRPTSATVPKQIFPDLLPGTEQHVPCQSGMVPARTGEEQQILCLSEGPQGTTNMESSRPSKSGDTPRSGQLQTGSLKMQEQEQHERQTHQSPSRPQSGRPTSQKSKQQHQRPPRPQSASSTSAAGSAKRPIRDRKHQDERFRKQAFEEHHRKQLAQMVPQLTDINHQELLALTAPGLSEQQRSSQGPRTASWDPTSQQLDGAGHEQQVPRLHLPAQQQDERDLLRASAFADPGDVFQTPQGLDEQVEEPAFPASVLQHENSIGGCGSDIEWPSHIDEEPDVTKEQSLFEYSEHSEASLEVELPQNALPTAAGQTPVRLVPNKKEEPVEEEKIEPFRKFTKPRIPRPSSAKCSR